MTRSQPSFVPISCLIAILIFGGLNHHSAVQAQNWTRFRGENGAGLSDLKGIPLNWSESDYAWTFEPEHVGHSSPVVWEKSVFITSASEGGTERFVHCLDADTGKERWKVSLGFAVSEKHQKNSWASSTPTTDGERIYAIFSDDQSQIVTAWDFQGKEIWHRDLGPFGQDHGQGVSPIVSNGLLIVPNDQPGPSSLLALDAKTGNTVWNVDRPVAKTSFSTPMLLPGRGQEIQLISLSEAAGLTSHDLMTGKLNWQSPAMPMRTVASPVVSEGLLIAFCGTAGNGKYLMAVNSKIDAPGDSRIVFERKTQLPYVPTPIAVDELLFLWGDAGLLVCLEMPTGRELWAKRIANATFSSSPVYIDGHLYGVSEDGEVFIVKAARDYELAGRVSLGQPCHATPAVANGHLYLRTFHKLFALKAR